MGEAIVLESVTKTFGPKVAVEELDLVVPEAGVYGFIGPNGAGKTTTIRMVMSILFPDRGKISVLGHDSALEAKDRIGYLPEERGVYRKMKAGAFLGYMARLKGCDGRGVKTRVGSWLEKVGLADVENKRCEELSKGMQQKIQLVGTVLHQPDLVILDEPFSGLDPINQGLFKDMLAEFKRDGRTILFSTHIMEQAEKLCDHICLISGGLAVLTGALTDIKRDFGGNTYRLAASGDQGTLETIAGVEGVTAYDAYYRLLLGEDATASTVLAQIVQQMDVHEFRSEEPELEEIFIKAVRDAA